MRSLTIAAGIFAAAVTAGSTAIAQQIVTLDPGNAIPQTPMVTVRPDIHIQPGVNPDIHIQPRVRTDIHIQPKARIINVAQVKDDLFAGTEKFAQGASEVTEINLDPKSMGIVAGGRGKGALNDEALARKMHYMMIREYKYDKPGMYKMEDLDVYRKKLEDGSWSCSVRVRKQTETTDICSRGGDGNSGSEMVILEAKPQKLTFIRMSGSMSLDDLSNMGGAEKEPKAPKGPKAPTTSVPPKAPSMAAPSPPAVPASPM